MKQDQIEEYEINPYTMFIQPLEYGSKLYTQIYEMEDEFTSPLKPIEIIKNSCEYFSSSFEGRKNGTKQLIGITHKVPIAIDPTNFIYFFPTTSPSRPDCIWVSHEHVLKFSRVAPNETEVTFQNKQSFKFPISYSSFENQLFRTAFLRTKLMQRIGQTERRSIYMMNRPKLEASEKRRDYK